MLLASATAVKVSSDPVCSSAGCTQYKHPKPKLGYELDYPVPNLGQDRDIKANFNSLQKAEEINHHHWVFGTKESKEKWKNPAKETMYNFAPALDSDVVGTQKSLHDTEGALGHEYHLIGLNTESDPICSSAGCTQYKHPKKELGYELDYPVPNFGQDREIKDNFNSLNIAEKINQHHWDFKLEKPPLNPAKKTLYNFAPTLDEDIKDSQKNLKDTEGVLGQEYHLVGLNSESDPICSSAGCWQSEYTKQMWDKIVQYPDPEAQGLDSDIRTTLHHEQAASDGLGHVWDPFRGM